MLLTTVKVLLAVLALEAGVYASESLVEALLLFSMTTLAASVAAHSCTLSSRRPFYSPTSILKVHHFHHCGQSCADLAFASNRDGPDAVHIDPAIFFDVLEIPTNRIGKQAREAQYKLIASYVFHVQVFERWTIL